MSSHPNAMLKLTLTPDGWMSDDFDLMGAILTDNGVDPDEVDYTHTDINFENQSYSIILRDEDYDECEFGVDAEVGEIMVTAFLTYGYQETMSWERAVEGKGKLERWAVGVCAKYGCTYKLEITANYW
jgi:hypothetical protein